MIMSRANFFQLIQAYTSDCFENLFVIFGAFYTEREAENATKKQFNIEILEFNGMDLTHTWLNDWDEGQEFINFQEIYSESQLVEILLKGEEKNEK